MFYPIVGMFLGAGIGGLIWGYAGAIICAVICVIAMVCANQKNVQSKTPLNMPKETPQNPPPLEEPVHLIQSFKEAGKYYEITHKQATCTCPDWLKNRGLFPVSDPRRLCKHIIQSLYENQVRQHKFTLFQEKLDWCFENGRGFPMHCEIFRSEDEEFEIVGFIPNVEQWNFNEDGFWIDIYYKNIRFGFNPVLNIWTKNSKILTDAVNMEKAILNDILPTYPLWEKNKGLINKTEKPVSKLQSILNPERREYLRSLDDFDRWITILSDDLDKIHKFDLFGTKAAILWSDGEKDATVVCINRFTREMPDDGSKYDNFQFNLPKWYWYGYQPRGCANRIKMEFTKLFESEIKIN